MEIRKLLMIALAVAITFAQEQALMFIPNVQLTVVLVIVFASMFTLRETIIYILSYVFLDSLYMGGFNIFYMMPMIIAWGTLGVTTAYISKKTESEMTFAVIGLLFGFVYGWMFIPFMMIQTGITNLWPYLIADLPFEIIMATTGFVTTLWMYKPLTNTLKQVLYQKRVATIKTYK